MPYRRDQGAELLVWVQDSEDGTSEHHGNNKQHIKEKGMAVIVVGAKRT